MRILSFVRPFAQARKLPTSALNVASIRWLPAHTYIKQQQAIKVKTGQFTEDIKIVEVETYMAPEVPAAQFWLKNRKPDQWRDKSDVNLNVTSQEQALSLLK